MDLTTTYLGLNLRSPIVPSAALPLSEDIDTIKRLEDAGAAAVVLHSLFEEQLLREKFELHHHLEYGTESFAEALSYFPEPDEFHVGPELYLKHIRQAKAAVNIPIIGSLNGFSSGGWVEYAKLMQEAGADAIELNIYYVPTDFNMTGAQVEQNYIDTLSEVKKEVTIPVALKLSPFFSNMANMAKRLSETGADGLVLFNRFLQPDINAEDLEIEVGSVLSSTHDLRLPMRWIAILYGRINDCDLAATSGVQRGHDVIKLLMAGASVTQVCSTLLRHGIGHIQVMEEEINHWMEEHGYESVKQMQGSMSQLHCEDESAYERAQYMRAITSYNPTHSLV
ncbi:dihydroorotate dehydrogenase-like protein [Roseofilum sp. BLCC_M154]|uniref:Dihydroorotate dehydrogenase-like protein n=1 Tax=Roseofilum acuticapitatum BLCC-M154 TaxID=3022444 RepID=A0ABT7AYA1_9CYAN|nr:dihydroorotate dehydrogenase-like protein [Roseofilum acuticapitatum]MDJ1171830.1 dihydroorotate dehydrogenase-like protein [Roseofilum acuticapitatum BLCC-M154]